MSDSEHEFGGVSTDLKLSMVEGYLGAFTKALRGKFKELWYIDAFAGTGERTVKIKAEADGLWDSAERIERRRGSALIALQVDPSFDRVVFIEKKRSHCEALRHLKAEHEKPGQQIDVFRGDANSMIVEFLKGRTWSGVRAVMFLDPYGLNLHWSTLEAIKATGAIDIWYLVSLEGLFRQASKDPKKLSSQKRHAITRMLGTGDWEAEWYKAPASTGYSLLDHMGITESGDNSADQRRTATVSDMEDYVLKRLKTLFRLCCHQSDSATKAACIHSRYFSQCLIQVVRQSV
ncbi:MAG: three-Cys-motif partner protein TcmP [Caulobacteraceae bacterium]